jgi:DNA polymerase-3 subunit alpha
MRDFAHLNVHSEFSLKDGLAHVDDIIAAVKKAGMSAIALTDHMNIFGLVKFYKKAVASGIKPIIGAEVLLQDSKHPTVYYPLRLLAKNDAGYLHLKKILSYGYQHGQHDHQIPHITFEVLKKSVGTILVLVDTFDSVFTKAILAKEKERAKSLLQEWSKTFPNDLYIEVARVGAPDENTMIAELVDIAVTCGVPLVATNRVRFLKESDFYAHEARVCIAHGHTLDDPRRDKKYTQQQYLKTAQEMAELFNDIPSALENANEIAKRCTVKLELGKVCLPQFEVSDGLSIDAYLRHLSNEGLKERFPNGAEPVYVDRLHRELDVIISMGFAGYFLIVADFIGWAKHNKIPVGPGRGSGAGSLVAYVLHITNLDPIDLELLFERFLNPERVSMPDFDIDFCMQRRDEVIEYVAQKYGRHCVSQIITFGTMSAKAVVRDVGRVLSFPYGFVDKIAKLIPFELGITLEKSLEQEELQKRYQQEDEVRQLIDLAKQLEGVTRHAGKHAGGVVIAPNALTDFSAIYCESQDASIVTHFDKDDIESVGLVKFDFLGLRTLTIIDWAVQTINQFKKSDESTLNIDTIPLDDEKTFDLLKSNETHAVFQLESHGMRDLIRRLQPDCFDDITALVALFRPGPLQSGMVDDFIDRKHGRAEVVYDHPALESILKPTYGVILYQEQVMQIAQVLANYSLGGADILRRAMGKKKPEEMEMQRSIFIKGCGENNIAEKTSNDIFDLIAKFAGYGFNKSHSAAYALLAYQTAWLKANYPEAFMAAVLSSDMDNTDKVDIFYKETKRLGIAIPNPNINKGFYHFTVNDQSEICYGLGAIKGLGQGVIDLLVSDRNQKGPYKNLFDLVSRLTDTKLNRRALEAMIYAGACDDFGVDRSVLIASVDSALKQAQQTRSNKQKGQKDLFADLIFENQEEGSAVDYAHAKPFSKQQILAGEKSALGFYLTGHPMDRWAKELKAITRTSLSDVRVSGEKAVLIAGQLQSVRVIQTKTGRLMAVCALQDSTGSMDVTIFSKLFLEIKDILKSGQLVICKGPVSVDDFSGGVKMVADDVMPLEHWRLTAAQSLSITLTPKNFSHDTIDQISEIFKKARGGQCKVKITYQSDVGECQLNTAHEWVITPTDIMIQDLETIIPDAFELEYLS